MTKFNGVNTTPIVLLDTDVIINWLTKEENLNSNTKLWIAPNKIIKLIESKSLRGILTITTLMEIRFVLSRKKLFPESTIKLIAGKILEIMEVVVANELTLIQAETIQSHKPSLSPFDAILIASATSTLDATLISRDKVLLVLTPSPKAPPEEFLSKFNL